jgi:hypothetical protein
MASIIRIKRSSVSGNPSTLGAGELAYSNLTDNGSNGGDRLYIGMGSETAGNAANHIVIGGKYFTDMLDHTKGVLTANSALLVDANSKLDNLKVDNLDLNGNELSSTNANGNILITPNGTGKTIVTNLYTDSNTSLAEYIQDVTGGQLVDSSEIAPAYNDVTGTTTLALKTTGVTAGSYGSTTKIPTFTVDTKGRLSAAGEVDVATTLSLIGDTGSDGISLLSETLTIVGGEGIDTAVTANTLTISAELASTSNKGVASFETADFNVTSGAVELKDTVVKSFTTDSGSLTPTSHGVSILGGEGIDVTHSGNVITVAGEDASTTNKGVASFNTDNFTVTSGAVSTKTITLGNTTLTNGSTTTGITGLSEVEVDNIRVDGNTISSTNTDGNIVISPNGNGSVDVSSSRIINLSEPVADSDAATKYYVDAARSGLDIKNSVKAATTANITLSNTQTIDGVALSVGDRVLVKDQTNSAQNGIYVVASGSWTRSTDADAPAELNPGTFVFVEQGSVNSDTGFVVVSDGALTIGTDPIQWTLFSTSGTLIAGAGLSKNGYTLEVNVAGSGGIEIVSDNLQLKSTIAGAGLIYDSGVLDIVGTANRITVSANGIDIASTYVGQTSITTLGTITTGTWQADVIQDAYIANDLTIVGGTINNTPIGATTRSSGAFTTLSANSTLGVTGAATLGSTLSVTGAATLSSTLSVSGNATFAANLTGAGADTSNLDGFNIDGGTY